MKDIDFDELDRAVNSLINKPAPDSGDKAASVPVATTSAPAPTPIATPATDTPQVAPRSSGRFMDVVHPSSDMRSSPSLAARSVPSRESMTVTPPEAANEPTVQNPPTSIPPGPSDKAAAPTASNWPDSINMTQTPNNNEPALPESPFLSDAKVEKRPLGAFSTETPEPGAPSAEPESETPTTPETADRKDHPIETDTPLPAELQDNLLSIEDGEDPVAAVPTSITQQYAEQPSTGDQPTGAIFNTDAYHKPLAHPAKKKSGWLIVLWIVLLLIVGAGAGVVVYFYVLPLM